jgi:hypothetical protein
MSPGLLIIFGFKELGSTVKLPSLPSAVTFFNGANASSEVTFVSNTS